MFRNMLNIKNGVVIRKIVESYDGYGSMTTTTTLTTIARASIWSNTGGDPLVSEKITNASTHILALEYGEYSFTDSDREVIYNGNTYELTGHADNVAERNEILIVGLKWLS